MPLDSLPASSSPLRRAERLIALSIPALLIAGLSGCHPRPAPRPDHPLTRQVQVGIASGEASSSHSELDELLRRHVRASGRVDYAGLRSESALLDAYLRRLAEANLASLSRDELLAFLINAYNAYTLDVIVRNASVESIKDLDPWDRPLCRVGGETVSLNFIEHSLLRVLFDEPRIHFAINCASVGCPPLRAQAYSGNAIDAQLTAATGDTLQDDRYLRVEGERVRVTRILQWFRSDFVSQYGSLSEFLAPRVREPARRLLERRGEAAIAFLDYDWSLNDIATRGGAD